MITITDAIIITIIIIAIITIAISPGLNAHTYAHNRWEAGSRYRWKIWVWDLLSPRSNCLPFLQNLRLQLSTPWSWGIVRFRLGGCAKDKIQTMIYTNVMILAAQHPLPATCLTPPGAWHLEHNKSLHWSCRRIFGRSRVFHGKLLADGKLWVRGSFG